MDLNQITVLIKDQWPNNNGDLKFCEVFETSDFKFYCLHLHALWDISFDSEYDSNIRTFKLISYIPCETRETMKSQKFYIPKNTEKFIFQTVQLTYQNLKTV